MGIFKQEPPPGLRPNCLLTRYPICFLHGLKSIFNFRNYWHGIPEYLAAHGYEIFEMQANWRGPNMTRLKQWAMQLERTLATHDRVHLITHSLGALNALELCSWPVFENKFASLTLVSPPLSGTPWAELGRIGKIGRHDFFEGTNSTLTKTSAEKIVSHFTKANDMYLYSFTARPKLGEKRSPKLALQHKLLSSYLKRRNLDPENDGLVPLASQRVALNIGATVFEFPGDHHQVIGAGPWPRERKTAHEVFLDHSILLAENDAKPSK